MQLSQTQTAPHQISSTYFGRVIGWFGLALGVSALGAYIGFNYALPAMVSSNMLMIGAIVLELILILTSRYWSKIRPLNYILFALFAFASGFTLAPILYMSLSVGNGDILYRALGATMVTFVAAGLIAWKTSIDMFKFQGFLFFALIGMIIVGLIGIFFPFGSLMESLYTFFGILLFTGYIMFDMQRIKYGAGQNEMELALALYLDIFNLFLYILRFLSRDH